VEGFIAVTDHGWYEHLSREPGAKDANFWRPSTRTVRLPIGTPFLFKLKAPYNAVAGFGFFAGYSILPDWLAWETFGEANGVAELGELRSRLTTIQRGARIAADPGGRIGCSLIAEAQFFARDAWVRTPSDWHPRTQQGQRYDLEQGEGRRVWMECQERASRAPGAPAHARIVETVEGLRYGAPSVVRPRLGQGIFRVKVLDAYGRACAVTGEHSLPVLEAAHIKPYAIGGDHAVENGLTLRTDLHRLFDRGYVTVDEDHRFVVGRRLKQDFQNGRSYYVLHGRQLALPAEAGARPDAARLGWHREVAFLG
jgi:putative restriction endonuclease